MANYEIPTNPTYSEVMRKLETNDPATAELFNSMFQQMLNNFAAISKGKVAVGKAVAAEQLGGETATQWQTKIDNIQTTSRATLSQAGWYRVAEYESTTIELLKGSSGNSCDLRVKSLLQSRGQNNLHLTFNALYEQPIFQLANSRTRNAQLITKIRHTYSATEGKSWLEVYYSVDVSNMHIFSIDSGMDVYMKAWKAITPTLTSETVSGVTVTTTYDIPANASPVTDLDLASYFKNTGGEINGDVTIASSNAVARRLMVKNSKRRIDLEVGQDGVGYLFDSTNGKSIIQSSLNGAVTYAGGEFSGDVTVKSASATARALAVQNSLRRVVNYIDANGVYQLRDITNNKHIIDSSLNGTNTFNGVSNGNLPLTGGGTIDGNITVQATDASRRRHALKNSVRCVYQDIGVSGDYYLYDSTNSKDIIRSNKDGTNTFNGTASGNIAKEGTDTQTVKATSAVPFAVHNNTENATQVYQRYMANNAILGVIGFAGVDIPVFMTASGSSKKLLHEGNYGDYNTFSKGISLTNANADEGGEIRFASPVTDHAFGGMITQDIWRNMMRIFATHDGKTKLFNIDFASMKEGGNEALHTGNSAKVLVQSTPLTEAGSVRVW